MPTPHPLQGHNLTVTFNMVHQRTSILETIQIIRDTLGEGPGTNCFPFSCSFFISKQIRLKISNQKQGKCHTGGGGGGVIKIAKKVSRII